MKKEFDLKIDGGTLENIKIDSSNNLIIATYTRDAERFKSGDILVDAYDECGGLRYISMFKEKSKLYNDNFSAFIVFDIHSDTFRYPASNWDGIKNNRLATDEEKQLLFDALKKEGLKWNAETLEVEKLAPKFKRGDILASKISSLVLIFDKYTSRNAFRSLINNKDQDRSSNNYWTIPPFRHASTEEIEVFYKDLARMGKKWNAETLEIEEVEKLDISEIVVDYESAIEYLGIKDTLLVFKNYDRVEKFNAQIKLQLIAEAWNKFDEFEVDWENYDQDKHYPIFEVEDGKFEFLMTNFFRVLLNPQSSNFSFKTEERATQFGNQFIDLFKVALGL